MYQGWTQELTPDRRQENALRSVLALLTEDPNNAYWRGRLAQLAGSWHRAAFLMVYALARPAPAHVAPVLMPVEAA